MQYKFPAIFESDDGGVAFHFYDRPDWLLCGDNLNDAVDMAEDVLNGALLELEKDNSPVPVPSKLEEIKLKPNQVLRMIEADTEKYAAELKLMEENPIKFEKERAGLSIKELAELLDAPYRTVQEWIRGTQRPPRWVEKLVVEKILDSY